MQIIIPMTGHVSRFIAQGYKRLKPFIKIHQMPMIELVIKMFPGDHDKITFICRAQHLKDKRYISKELNRIAPKANIFKIKDWKKQLLDQADSVFGTSQEPGAQEEAGSTAYR